MSTPLSPVKQVRKAARCNQLPVATIQAPKKSLTEDEDLVMGLGPVSQKLDAMMIMLLDLMRRVQATENQMMEKDATFWIA